MIGRHTFVLGKQPCLSFFLLFSAAGDSCVRPQFAISALLSTITRSSFFFLTLSFRFLVFPIQLIISFLSSLSFVLTVSDDLPGVATATKSLQTRIPTRSTQRSTDAPSTSKCSELRQIGSSHPRTGALNCRPRLLFVGYGS